MVGGHVGSSIEADGIPSSFLGDQDTCGVVPWVLLGAQIEIEPPLRQHPIFVAGAFEAIHTPELRPHLRGQPFARLFGEQRQMYNAFQITVRL